MSSPILTDRDFATIDLHYRSGRRHHFDTTIEDARNRAKTAIDRKAVVWVKVTIPHPTWTQAKVCVWDRVSKWTAEIVDLPKTKD